MAHRGDVMGGVTSQSCSVLFSSVQFSSRVCQYTFTLISLNRSADARERIRAAVKVQVRSIMMVLLICIDIEIR